MFCDFIPVLNAKESISMTLKLNFIEDLKNVSFIFLANKRNIFI
jgi:hypothetical protein